MIDHQKPGSISYQSLRTVKGIAVESGGTLTEPTIRWWIFNERDNGFSKCIVRVNRRVYINTDALNQWLAESQVRHSERQAHDHRTV